MGDDVAGAVDFEGVIALQCMGAVGSDGGGHEAGPPTSQYRSSRPRKWLPAMGSAIPQPKLLASPNI